jgi:hypothetical protein
VSTRTRCTAALLCALLSWTATVGCGDSPHDSAVVVDGSPITAATVQHWISVDAGGIAVQRLDKARYRDLKDQVVALLIDWRWLIGEAKARGLAVSNVAARHRMSERNHERFPGGSSEAREYLTSSGQSTADVLLEVTAELAESRIRTLVAGQAPKPTQAALSAYYKRHQREFLVPEERTIEITNRKSWSGAEGVRRAVASGASFPLGTKHEQLETSHSADERTNALERTIDVAPLNIVAGPVRVRDDYYVLEVKKIAPARFRTLTEVRHEIQARLEGEEQEELLAAFIRSWRTHWSARTDCHAGYVVEQCSQYAGPRVPQAPLSID